MSSICFLTPMPLCKRPHKQTTQAHRTRITPHASSSDLLIVGAGHLGRLVGSIWRWMYPDSTIHAETLTDNSHSHLRSVYNFSPAIVPNPDSPIENRVPYGVFCAPPGRAASKEEYARMVAHAASRVDRFVFTSSTSIYGNTTGTITEDTPADVNAKLFQAEQAALNTGKVVRLAGLYLRERGAHSYYIQKKKILGDPQALLNLIHYDDAAQMVVNVLIAQAVESNIFLASGKNGSTKESIVQAALTHPIYEKCSFPEIHSGEKKDRWFDNSKSRELVRWRPRFESFEQYMAWDGRNWRLDKGE